MRIVSSLCRLPPLRKPLPPSSTPKAHNCIMSRVVAALTSLSPEALFHSSEVFSRQNNHTAAASALAAAVRERHPRAHAALSWLLQEGRHGVNKHFDAGELCFLHWFCVVKYGNLHRSVCNRSSGSSNRLPPLQRRSGRVLSFREGYNRRPHTCSSTVT